MRGLAAVILTILALLLSAPAFAQGLTAAALADTWHLRGLLLSEDAAIPSTSLEGEVLLDAGGNVAGGSVTHGDGSTFSFTAGRIAIDATGGITGSVSVGGAINALQGAMLPDRQAIAGVATQGRVGHRQFSYFVLVRHAQGAFGQSDLADVWHIAALEKTFTGGGVWAAGRVSVDFDGKVIAGQLAHPPPAPADTFTSGLLSIDADGLVTGSVAAGVNAMSIAGAMVPGKQFIVGVGQVDVTSPVASAQGVHFFYLVRHSALTHDQAEVAGTWRLQDLSALGGGISFGNWNAGTIGISATGAAAGTLTTPFGSAALNGSLSVSADGTVSGSVTRPIDGAQIDLSGVMLPGKDVIVGVNTLVSPRLNVPTYSVFSLVKAASTVQLSAASYAVRESAGAAVITVTRTGSTTGAVSVDYATSNGTGAAGVDYTAASGTLTFAAGQVSRTFSVPVNNDSVVNGNRTVNVTLSAPTGGAVLGARTSAVLTVLDDDLAGSVQLSSVAYSIAENAGSATITVIRSGGAASAVTVAYATSNGTATAGTDYTATSGTLTFDAGVTTRSFTVPIADNALADANRTFTVTLSAPGGGAALGLRKSAMVTILDDEPGLRLSSASYNVRESAGAIAVTVLRTGPLTGTLSAQYATSDGTAHAGVDYKSASGTLTFAPGVISRVFTVPVVNDTIVDGVRTFGVTLSSPGGAVLGVPSTATVSIADDDLGGQLQFSAAAYAVAEQAGSAIVTVVRSGGAASAVTVDYATSNGTAIAGTDYTATTGTLTFAAGQVSRTFTVPVANDTIVDGRRTVNLTLSNAGGGGSLGARTSAVLTIIDEDVAGIVQLSSAAYKVAENGSSATVTVLRSGGAASAVTVAYATGDGTAVAGTDYTATNGTVTFGAGVTSQSFTVPIVDNALADGNRTFNVTLSAPGGGATLGLRKSAAVTILDDEPGLRLSSVAYGVKENAGALAVTVLRTGPLTGTLTVQYATSDGSAHAGVDYTGTAGVLTFGPGVTSKAFVVPVLNNTIVDGLRTFSVALGIPGGGAVIGLPSAATVSIADDDLGGQIQFSATAYAAGERVGNATITVTRTGGGASAVTVNYATSNGTAVAGTDYTATTGTLTFTAGQMSRTFSVPVLDNTILDGNRTVNLTLSSAGGGGTLGARTSAVLTIANEDVAGTVQLSALAYTIAENAGSATITAIRSGGAASAVTVDYATSHGTAVAGTDYTTVSGTLTFGAGVTSQTFTVPVIDNASADGNRSLIVTLSAPGGGASLGPRRLGTVTILDDEQGLGFSSAAYSAQENVGAVGLIVPRTGPLSGTVTVSYATADGTARAGVDYRAASGTLTFGPGVASLRIVVPVILNRFAQADRTFTVTLSDPAGGAILRAPAAAAVTLTGCVGCIALTPDYFPDGFGDRWSYRGASSDLAQSFFENIRVTGERQIGTRIARVFFDDNQTGSGTAAESYYVKSASAVTFVGTDDRSDFISLALAPMDTMLFGVPLSNTVLFAKAGRIVGRDLDGDGRFETLDGSARATFLGFERVVTPAGVFPSAAHVRISTSLTFHLSRFGPLSGTEIDDDWFVPGVGQVQERALVRLGGQTVTGELNLRGYRVNGKGAGYLEAKVLAPDIAAGNSGNSGGGPAVGAGGDGFLLVHREQFDIGQFPPRGWRWRARVVHGDGEPGPAVDISGETGNEGRAAVAFDGTNFLVVTLSGGEPIRANRVTAAGVLVDPMPGTAIADAGAGGFAVAFGAGKYLVVYAKVLQPRQLYGRIISPDGTLGTEFVIHDSAGAQRNPSVAFDGTNFLAVWEHDADGAPFTGDSDIFGARVAADGTVLNSAIVISSAPESQMDPKVACDMANCLVTWIDQRNFPGIPQNTDPGAGDVYGTRISNNDTVLDGPTDSGGLAIATGTPIKLGTALVFTGNAYMVAWLQGGFLNNPGGPPGAFASRVGLDGALLEGSSGVVISGRPEEFTTLRLLSTTYGPAGGLVVWQNNIETQGSTKSIRGAQFYPLAGQ